MFCSIHACRRFTNVLMASRSSSQGPRSSKKPRILASTSPAPAKLERTILGSSQVNWFENQMRTSASALCLPSSMPRFCSLFANIQCAQPDRMDSRICTNCASAALMSLRNARASGNNYDETKTHGRYKGNAGCEPPTLYVHTFRCRRQGMMNRAFMDIWAGQRCK